MKNKLLTIDIGNTNLVFGIFENENLLAQFRLETKSDVLSDLGGTKFLEFFSQATKCPPGSISAVCMASVVPSLNAAVIQICETLFSCTPYVITHRSNLGITIDVDAPECVGSDRLVNAAYAFQQHHTDLIVIDFGTATTFDCVTADGKFIGGLICPGPHISAEALFSRTAQIKPVEMAKPTRLIGKTTWECVQSGLYYGYVGMIEGIVARIEKERETKMTVIATGGLSSLFLKDCKCIDHHDPALTLKGLKLIHEWRSAS